MMELTKYEMETIYNYNQEEPLASCYTMDRALIRRLDALAQKHKEITVLRADEGVRELLSLRSGLRSAHQRNYRKNREKTWQRERVNDLDLRRRVTTLEEKS